MTCEGNVTKFKIQTEVKRPSRKYKFYFDVFKDVEKKVVNGQNKLGLIDEGSHCYVKEISNWQIN